MKRLLLVIAMLGLGACLAGCPSSSSPTTGPKVDPAKQFPPGVAAPVKADPAKPGAGKPGEGGKAAAPTPTK